MTPDIICVTSIGEAARVAAERWVQLAPRTIALSGGSTPRALHALLVSSEFKPRIDWAATTFFFGDERAVPPDHADSNFGMAQRTLLAHVPSRAHRMEGEAADLDATALRYESLLPEAFDLMLVGLGPDGHTASLFPNTAAATEMHHRVVRVPAPTHIGPHVARLSCTAPVLNAARHLLALVVGAEKAAPLQRALEGPFDPSATPAQHWRRAQALTVICDHAAAALLKR